MRYIERQAGLGLLVVLLGCGEPLVTQGARCLTLNVPEGQEALSIAPPARVSLFFSVDTCDGVPVSGLGAEAFEVQEDGKPLSALESKRAVRAKGQRFRMASVLLLDLSGSVLRTGDFGPLKDAAARYVRTVLGARDDGQRLAIYTFDGREHPEVLVDFTGDQAVALRGLEGLETRQCSVNADCAGFTDRRTCAGWRCVDDSTNLNGAVVKTLDRLEEALAQETLVAWKEGALVVFTDGSDQAARVSTFEMLERANRSTVRRFTVGLGGEIDEKTLRALGADGSWPVGKATALSEAFDAVAAKVTARANRFYLLEYCSPKRSGQHSAKVVARWTKADGETLTGGLSRTFDATGFASGCELSE
ncbi:MAG: VWA domain-containing protein [Myxococcus sp.]|nr:VWA domain-containing protein [Myxococcus sp.]